MAKSILIIEDDKNIAELERDYLEANGYEVDTKLNGESGLEAALKQNYNLILLDLMLPGMDGYPFPGGCIGKFQIHPSRGASDPAGWMDLKFADASAGKRISQS